MKKILLSMLFIFMGFLTLTADSFQKGIQDNWNTKNYSPSWDILRFTGSSETIQFYCKKDATIEMMNSWGYPNTPAAYFADGTNTNMSYFTEFFPTEGIKAGNVYKITFDFNRFGSKGYVDFPLMNGLNDYGCPASDPSVPSDAKLYDGSLNSKTIYVFDMSDKDIISSPDPVQYQSTVAQHFQQAIAVANDGDTIRIYSPKIQKNLLSDPPQVVIVAKNDEFKVNKAVTIDGLQTAKLNAMIRVDVPQGSTFRALHITCPSSGSTTSLKNFNIQGGNITYEGSDAASSGGALLIDGEGNIELQNLFISLSGARLGSGVCITTKGNVSFINSNISNKYTNEGGPTVYIEHSGKNTDLVFSGNKITQNKCITPIVPTGTLKVSNEIPSDNSTLTFTDNTIDSNYFENSSDPDLNIDETKGYFVASGALITWNGPVIMKDNTITNNIANNRSCGIIYWMPNVDTGYILSNNLCINNMPWISMVNGLQVEDSTSGDNVSKTATDKGSGAPAPEAANQSYQPASD